MSQVVENADVTKKPFGDAGKDSTRAKAKKEVAAFREYLVALKRSPATVSSYTGSLAPFFAFLERQGICDLRAVRRGDIYAYQTELIEKGRPFDSAQGRSGCHSQGGKGGYTLNSVNIFIRSLRRFYEFLEKTGKVLINPAESIKTPKAGNSLPRAVLTLSEVRRLLDVPDTSLPGGVKDKAILEVLYSTGIRVGELCALTIHDVDARNGVVRINHGKGGKDRMVPLGHKAGKYVSEYLHHIRGGQTAHNRDERALFINRNGNPIDRQNVQLLVKACAKRAGISKQVSPHSLRHTCATHMVADGADIAHVQRLLGHESLDTTQIYVRVAQREIKLTHRRTHPREKDRK